MQFWTPVFPDAYVPIAFFRGEHKPVSARKPGRDSHRTMSSLTSMIQAALQISNKSNSKIQPFFLPTLEASFFLFNVKKERSWEVWLGANKPICSGKHWGICKCYLLIMYISSLCIVLLIDKHIILLKKPRKEAQAPSPVKKFLNRRSLLNNLRQWVY